MARAQAFAFVAKLDVSGAHLVYSTVFGGSAEDDGNSIAVDKKGQGYVAGTTYSTNFPSTTGALQSTAPGGADAFLTKFNSNGAAIAYSTFIGGRGTDYGLAVAVDGEGSAFVTGNTNSPDFPVTAGAFQTSLGGAGNVFVTKLNGSGSTAIYSTHLGTLRSAISVPQSPPMRQAVPMSQVAHARQKCPTTPDALQPIPASPMGADAFVTTFNAQGSGLIYSSYLGGSADDGAMGIAVDPMQNVYVVGWTLSADFPTTPGAIQAVGADSGFVTKITNAMRPPIKIFNLAAGYYKILFGVIQDGSSAVLTASGKVIGVPPRPGDKVMEGLAETLGALVQVVATREEARAAGGISERSADRRSLDALREPSKALIKVQSIIEKEAAR